MYQNPKKWDLALAQAKFSYNDTPNRSTGMIPFQIFFGKNPRGVYELINRQEVQKLKSLQSRCRDYKKMSKAY